MFRAIPPYLFLETRQKLGDEEGVSADGFFEVPFVCECTGPLVSVNMPTSSVHPPTHLPSVYLPTSSVNLHTHLLSHTFTHPSICMHTYPLTHLPLCASIHPIFPSMYAPNHLTTYPSMHPCTHLPIHSSIHLSAHLPSVHLLIYLHIYPSIHPPIYLPSSIYLLMYISIHPPTHLPPTCPSDYLPVHPYICPHLLPLVPIHASLPCAYEHMASTQSITRPFIQHISQSSIARGFTDHSDA